MLVAQQQSIVRSGPMVGHVGQDHSFIWLQTRSEAEIQILFKKENGLSKNWRKTHFYRTQSEEHLTAKILLRTEFGSVYQYKVIVNGKESDLGGRFRTPDLSVAKNKNFKIATGSCVYINDEGIPEKGGDYQIFESIAAQKPDMMFWLGDNIYLHEMDWYSESGMAERYSKMREVPELQSLLANTAHYATWDDHDYGPNDSDRGFIGKKLALNAFNQFWPNPNYDLPPHHVGVRTSFAWADVDFFFLDNRYFRSPMKRRTGDRTVLGKAQLEWLIDALATSEASFKFVAIGTLVLSSSDNKKNQNHISNYASERDHLLKEIELNGIKNVVFLSGDKHFSEVSHMKLEGGSSVWEITSSPLTSNVNEREDLNRYRVEGSHIQKRNFSTIEVTGEDDNRHLIIQFFDADGKLLWRKEVHQED